MAPAQLCWMFIHQTYRTISIPTESQKNYIKTFAFSTTLPGHHLPRRAWIQLNRLRTGVGCFASNMRRMGLANTNICKCRSIQTAQHVLEQCPILRPPCSFDNTTNPSLAQCLHKLSFWLWHHTWMKKILRIWNFKESYENRIHLFWLE